MVKRSVDLDRIFGSLADATRRDILRRSARKKLSISELAAPYDLSLAAISKHIRVLQEAGLISKERSGKQYFIYLSPETFNDAMSYLRDYERLWNDRLDSLERYLSSSPN